MTKHPTDAMEMPPKAESALAKLSWASHVFSVIEPRDSFEHVSYDSALHDLRSAIHTLNNLDDQFRAERIKAYDLALEDAAHAGAMACRYFEDAAKVKAAIRSMKHEQQ